MPPDQSLEWLHQASHRTYVHKCEAHAVLKSLYGKIRWRFQDGNFYFTNEGTESGPNPYSLRPIDDEPFEIIITDGMTIEVTRTATGFCMQSAPVWVSEVKFWTDPSMIECFAPYGA